MNENPKADNLTWHAELVSREQRRLLNGHGACVIWFTGFSGSGKSTLSNRLAVELHALQVCGYVLDGDNLRHGLNRDLGFSPADRRENIRRVGEVAKILMDAGLIAITAFISPYRSDRDAVRSLLAAGDFIEIFLDCSLDACRGRDPKGLYKKADAGEIPEFTGVSAPYEPPLQPELTLKTDELSEAEAVDAIIAFLRQRKVIGAM
ncbi:MAG: adenylyl-sulfate kinase [Deltaproteobacteria bacterium]|nr:adenylyl-sulfate kinase [Candidatus Anaeroferrophillus wilburensis]MBN2889424.1 adenylyl-sulfate kinase [Deltaproteobacteria bacterium]